MHARLTAHALPRNALRARRACALLALALVLVLAQALGLMHRVTHHAPSGAPVAVQSAEAGNWVASLFAGHASDAECRLFDPLAHDGPPTVAVQLLPLVLSSFFLLISQGDFVARWSALFDARGPPLSR